MHPGGPIQFLRGPEGARLPLMPARSLHQPLMDLPDEPQGQRQRGQPLEAVVHGCDVVDDVLHVGHPRVFVVASFEPQHVGEGGLGTFDLRAQDSLTAHVHGHEQIWIGDDADDPIEPPQRQVSLG